MESLDKQLAVADVARNESCETARAKALRTYWQLVDRADNPPTGALDKLSAAFKVLGLNRQAFDVDLGRVRKLVKLAAHAARQADLKAAAGVAEKAFNEARDALGAKVKALEAEVSELRLARDNAHGRVSAAQDAANEAVTLSTQLAEARAAGPVGDVAR